MHVVVVLKFLGILTFLLAVAEFGCGKSGGGGGPCGNVAPDQVAVLLAPCAEAAGDARARVSPSCCSQTTIFGEHPKCLCAVLFSTTAKRFGVKPAIAITVPKRCNSHRPKGTKCGRYTVP